ncbi:MAG: glycosyltransferase family 9 protein [Cytophagaceae bacterium]|nr:glycosyltransferase family 9 protein [Cytophagaceae bacterium]
MKPPKNIMVFRFSAMGDVALTLVAFKILLEKYPQTQINLVTRSKFSVFFENQKGISVISVDFENYKGIFGLYNLYKHLKTFSPEIVFDLHQNIRTYFLKVFFRFSGIKSFTMDKGRQEKRALISNKIFKKLPHTVQRYLDTFSKSAHFENLIFDNKKTQVFDFQAKNYPEVNEFLQNFSEKKLIGIAPFAQHKGKIWPIENYRILCENIKSSFPDSEILIFGGGIKENELIDTNLSKSGNNMVGRFSLIEEIYLISNLKLMITGDSSNMHFAAMAGIPVISIWGATHHFAGFGPIFQPEENLVEIPKEELTCRPCSVYGNKPCQRGDYACLNWITPEMVLEKIKKNY